MTWITYDRRQIAALARTEAQFAPTPAEVDRKLDAATHRMLDALTSDAPVPDAMLVCADREMQIRNIIVAGCLRPEMVREPERYEFDCDWTGGAAHEGGEL